MRSKSRSLQFCVVPSCTQQLRLFYTFFSLFLIDVFSLFQYSLCLSSTSFFLTSSIFQSTFFYLFFTFIQFCLLPGKCSGWLYVESTLQREQQMHIALVRKIYTCRLQADLQFQSTAATIFSTSFLSLSRWSVSLWLRVLLLGPNCTSTCSSMFHIWHSTHLWNRLSTRPTIVRYI